MKKKFMIPIIIIVVILFAVVSIFLWERAHATFYDNGMENESEITLHLVEKD